MRLSVIVTAVSFSVISLAAAENARAAIRKPTEIPAQQLALALQALAKNHEFQVIYRSEIVGQRKSGGATGNLTQSEALDQLLDQTGLTYQYLDDHTVTILPVAVAEAGGASGEAKKASGSRSSSGAQAPPRTEESQHTPRFWDRFRLAQVDQAETAIDGSVKSSDTDPAGRSWIVLEEVVVSAQKRIEHLQDVPVPVTAISAESLLESNQVRLQDYSSTIPGFSVSTSSVAGYQLLSIRNITTGLANPTVGITVDDVPYGASTVNGGNVPPDIDPGDLERVEVLRGPQGTLYGASSIGGLLKYVTADPSTDGFSGRLQVGTSSVKNGDTLGYSVRGAFNAPLSDTVAIRGSAFTREDPGYIDDPALGIKGINEVNASGGHLSMLWQASASFSLKLSALLQELEGRGSSDVNLTDLAANVGYALPTLGDLQQSYIPGAGKYETQVQAYSATVNARVGNADLVAVTGYNTNEYFNTTDFTYLYGPYMQDGVPDSGFDGFGVPGSLLVTDAKGRKFSQEIRLSMPVGSQLDWLIGAFYTHENSPFPGTLFAEDPGTGEIAGLFGDFDLRSTFEEHAAFTNVTYRFTDRFSIQVGGRASEIRQTYQLTDSGPFVPLFEGVPSPNVGPEGRSKATAFTYLVTPQFKVSQDLMVYSRLASGYRAGGPNIGVGVPSRYNPDKTYNYEIGVKGDVLDHALSFDASVYYIQWDDIQATLFSPDTGLSFTDNVGAAKSQGVELAVESIPVEGLKIAGWVSWNDAGLTQNFPEETVFYGASGDRLPYASRFSGNFSLVREFNLEGRLRWVVGGDVSYVGDRVGTFQGILNGAPLPRQHLPAYAQTNLRVGVKYESWSGNLFVRNVTDKRGVLDGGIGTNIPYAFQYIQPRSVGLSLVKTY